jgi:hypothetical protein
VFFKVAANGRNPAAPALRAAIVMATTQEGVCSGSALRNVFAARCVLDVKANERPVMPRKLLLALLFTGALGATNAHAQITTPEGRPRADCPPGVGANAPSVGQDSKRTLSDQLAASKGVICPPAGVDQDMQHKPPEGGAMKVIPPPGSPGGNPNVQPK